MLCTLPHPSPPPPPPDLECLELRPVDPHPLPLTLCRERCPCYVQMTEGLKGEEGPGVFSWAGDQASERECLCVVFERVMREKTGLVIEHIFSEVGFNWNV